MKRVASNIAKLPGHVEARGISRLTGPHDAGSLGARQSGVQGIIKGENLTFHVIVDHAEKTFSMDGPDGPNGIWLHLEMVRVARERGKTFRDFDMRAPSAEEALTEMQSYLPSYSFIGPWSAEPRK